jgi:hypothetical protein
MKWWMRIIGTFYVLEGGGLTLLAIASPSEFAAMWASTEAGVLDAIAVRGTLVAGMPGVLTWLLLGIMLWISSRAPATARLLVVTVIAWELAVWLPLDVVGYFNGFEAGRAAALIAVHALIGVSGIVVLRRTPQA